MPLHDVWTSMPGRRHGLETQDAKRQTVNCSVFKLLPWMTPKPTFQLLIKFPITTQKQRSNLFFSLHRVTSRVAPVDWAFKLKIQQITAIYGTLIGSPSGIPVEEYMAENNPWILTERERLFNSLKRRNTSFFHGSDCNSTGDGIESFLDV